MDGLVLHEHTKLQLMPLVAHTPHALLLVGPAGIGKRHLAEAWASLLTVPAGITFVEPDEKNTTSIDIIRSLYQRTRAKQQNHQVVIIDHAEAMGNEAQNAFLKLLEEPRSGVTFVLTAPTLDVLLPTIASRTQHVLVQKVSQPVLETMLPKTIGKQDRAKLLFMADGRPATLQKLLDNQTLFAHQSELMQKAKTLLTAKQYVRLAAVGELTKNKDDMIFVLEAIAYMLKLQLARDPTMAQVAFADALNECLARLAANGNPRAQLTHLFTHADLV